MRRTLFLVRRWPRTALRAASSLYRSLAVGPGPQPDYFNAVLRIQTRLSPMALLFHAKRVEAAVGRRPASFRWAPRRMDVDILLYAGRVIESAWLRIPHPELYRRVFILIPLLEVLPQGRCPVRKMAFSDILAELRLSEGNVKMASAKSQWLPK